MNTDQQVLWDQCLIPAGRSERRVPFAIVDGVNVIVKGKWLKIASIRDEDWTEGQVVKDPPSLVRKLRDSRRIDLLTFTQKLPETTPKYPFPFEWDNVAAIPLLSYEDWWEKRLPQVTRKNVRRSAKRGVMVRSVPLDDHFIRDVMVIYNETPVRQGKPFTHYGKDFQTVKYEISTMEGRSEFFGAYSGEQLIGFIKLVYVGKLAGILHIVSLNSEDDKRPSNALIAKVVETCAARGITHVLYGKYSYGSQSTTPLAEFKHRNGFEQINVPRYFVPLSLKGSLAFKLRMHHGVKGMLPPTMLDWLLRVRFAMTRRFLWASSSSECGDADNAGGQKNAAKP